MKLSYNWLGEFVDLDGIDPYELGLRLTMSTSEIEGVEEVGDKLDRVVVGEIVDVKPHPDSDHLYITNIDVGDDVLQVVSGAPNTQKGTFVPVALIGAVLPGGMKVNRAKLKGVESFGVVCSEKELGVSDDHTGLWILSDEKIEKDRLKPGTPVSDLFPTRDYIIEIDNKSLTNRPDLWSHYGFAREIAAIYRRELKPLYPVDIYEFIKSFKGDSPVEVEVVDSELCPRYTAIVVDNVKIEKSPFLIRRRLYTLGVRPINNMVDITNWIMLEVGQPLHAFDGEKIKGNKIIVRRARDGEVLETLDNVKRILNHNNLVIADTEKAIALAGVMGGANTEIDENTKRVVIESANFNPVNIRRTAVSVGLRTEASNRFEKSLDPEYTVQGIAGAVRQMFELIEGVKLASPLIDKNYYKKPRVIIPLNFDWLDSMLGMKMDRDRVVEILQSLQFKVTPRDELNIEVEVPSFRATKDVSIPQDLVEEIGRIFGYDNITPELPLIKTTPPPKDDLVFFIRRIKRIASLALSLTEVYTYSFQDDAYIDVFYTSDTNFIRLKNPVGSHLSRMRRSIIPGLFSLIEKNLNYRDEFEIYEVGSIYNPDRKVKYQAGELPEEKKMLAALILKNRNERPLFFYLKGKLENLFSEFYLGNVKYIGGDDINWNSQRFDANNLGDFEAYHPYRQAFLSYEGTVFGFMAEINPKLLKSSGIDFTKKRAAVFELDLEILLEIVEKVEERHRYRKIPRYPEVVLALAVVVDEGVSSEEVHNFIVSSGTELLKKVELFDIYRGAPLPEGKKNLAFNLYYGTDERTLTEQEANEVHEKIAEKIRQHGWELR